MSKQLRLSDIKFVSYTNRFHRLYVAWQDAKDPRRSERLKKLLDRQLKLDFIHYKNSGQIAWAMEQNKRRKKGLNVQPLPRNAGKATRS